MLIAIMNNPKFRINRILRWIHCAALLTTSIFLFRSGMFAALSNWFSFHHPNLIATVWGEVDVIASLLLFPVSFAVLTKLRVAALSATLLSTLAFSVYATQTLLIVVDHFSDQTYLLVNPYLRSNPIIPLVVSFIALTISLLRIKTMTSLLGASNGNYDNTHYRVEDHSWWKFS
jgi:hypothetical protein